MRQNPLNQLSVATTVVVGVLFALLAGLLSLEEKLREDADRLDELSPIVLTRQTWLPSIAGGDQVVPIAWTESSVAELTEGLGVLGSASPIAARDTFVKLPSGTYERMTLLDVGPELLLLLQPQEPCSPSTVLVNGGLAGEGLGQIDGRAALIRQVPASSVTSSLAADPTGRIAVRCQPSTASSPRLVFLPHDGQGAQAFVTLRKRAAELQRDESSFAPVDVRLERLSDSVNQQVKDTFAWLPVFEAGFALLLALSLLGLSLFDAAKERGQYEIRRALGSPLARLWTLSAKRVTSRVGAALAVGLVLAGAATLATDLPPLGPRTLLQLGGLALVIALTSIALHGAYAIAGVDRRAVLTSSAAGNRWKTAAVGLCLMLLAMSLGSFATLTSALVRYANTLAAVPLGYRPQGVFAYEAIPLTPDAREGTNTLATLAAPVIAASSDATVICETPWALDGFALREAYKNASISLMAGPGIAKVLGIPVDGRDFSQTDMRSGTALLVQALDAGFADSVWVFGRVIGSVNGLKIGALTPQPRNTIIKALGKNLCATPTVLFRPRAGSSSAAQAAVAFGTALQLRFTSYRLGPPHEVIDLIAAVRKPITRLRDLAALGLVAALGSALLVASLVSAVYVRSHARILAIRHALGEAPGAAARGAGISALKFTLPGAGLACLAWSYITQQLSKKFAGFPPMPPWTIIAIAVGISLIIAGLVCLFSHRHISRSDLITALKVE